MVVNYLTDWILATGDETIPPLCVELVLRDGNSYYLHSFVSYEEGNESLVVRIWDLSTFTDNDLEELKISLNKISSRSQLNTADTIHPKLAWARLRLYLSDIAYCVERHDKLWPEQERPHLGFKPK